MREICVARLDKTRPVLILTREAARPAMTKVTVAPITTTMQGLSSEVPVGPHNGLDQASVISLDNLLTIPVELLGRTVGFLTHEQEALLARAIVLAYDLEIPLGTMPAHERRALSLGDDLAGGELDGFGDELAVRSSRHHPLGARPVRLEIELDPPEIMPLTEIERVAVDDALPHLGRAR